MWRKWPEQNKNSSVSKRHKQKHRRCYLDVPVALAQRLQAELLGNFGSRHSVGQILLVAEHEQNSVTELILVQHALQLITGFADTFPAHESLNKATASQRQQKLRNMKNHQQRRS
jgi:hypothetical protein